MRPQITTNINPCEHGFVSKMQMLIPANINEFTVSDEILQAKLWKITEYL